MSVYLKIDNRVVAGPFVSLLAAAEFYRDKYKRRYPWEFGLVALVREVSDGDDEGTDRG